MQSDITFYFIFLFASNAVKIIEKKKIKLANVTRLEYLQNLIGKWTNANDVSYIVKIVF